MLARIALGARGGRILVVVDFAGTAGCADSRTYASVRARGASDARRGRVEVLVNAPGSTGIAFGRANS